MPSDVRRLTIADWKIWREIRLESLQKNPEAFATSYEEDAREGDDYFKRMIENNAIFGAFENGTLAGVVGLDRPSSRIKNRHKLVLWGVYVRAEYRKKKLGDALMKTALAYAKQQVPQVKCSVNTVNPAAVKLYEKHGFKIYGTEPNSLLIDGKMYDEYLMIRLFS